MFGSTNPFGQSSNSPFGQSSVFGQTSSATSNPFSPRPFGSPFGSPSGTSIFGGSTSTGVFGQPSSPLTTPAFGASSTPAFGAASTPAFGASSSTFGSSSIFGSKPTFGAFGSSTPSQTSPFGGTQQTQPTFGSSLFGSTTTFGASQPAFGATSTPAFGSTSSPAFGATSTTAFGATSNPAFGATTMPAFGATSTPAFGSTSSPLFGGTGTAFGVSSAPAFGSTPAFGASSTSIFGSSSTPAFGATSSPAFGSSSAPAFGASSTPSFGFSSTPAFGQTTSAFGSTPFGSTSPFGAQSSPFGAQTTTPTFGSPGFGQPAFGGQQGGSRVAPYTPTPEVDGGTGTQAAGKLESISAMPVYKDKSHEELRWEDYQRGDKGGPNPAGQAAGAFSFPSAQTSPFGSTNTFGQTPSFSSATTNPFGQKPAFGSTGFGASSTPSFSSPFGVSSSSPFGSATASTTPSLFGSSTPAFGASSTPAFGSSSTPSFGASSTPAFGGSSMSAFGASSTPAFGASSTPAFGSSSTPAFGAISAPAFGASSSPSLFGGSTSSVFGSSPFGASSAAATTPAFGSGLNFGGTQSSGLFQSSSSFGQTPSLFGQPSTGFGQATSAFGSSLFSTPSTGFGGGLFSSSTSSLVPSSSPLGFGQSAPSLSSPFQPTAPAQTSGTFSFGGFGQTQPGASGFGSMSNVYGQGILGQSAATQTGMVMQPAPITSPFGTLPAMPQMSIGRVGSAPSVQYGISSIPVAEKPVPVRISSLLTPRHITQRRIKLPPRKYHPKTDGPLVPFFSEDEEGTSTPKADALFIPRENPRALIVHPIEKWPSHTSTMKPSMSRDETAPTCENGKATGERSASARNGSAGEVHDVTQVEREDTIGSREEDQGAKMLVQVPRLTSSLRGHYDVDQAYLKRKSFLRDYRGRRLHDDSELARKLVPGWEEASSDVRQACRKYLGAVVELVNGEVIQEEFQEIAKNVYDLLSSIYSDSAASKQIIERKGEVERLVGHSISELHLKKVALSAQRLFELQHKTLETLSIKENSPDVAEESVEFGSDLAFQAPARFLMEMSLEDGLLWEDETFLCFSNMEEDRQLGSRSCQLSTSNEAVNLRWLRDACDLIVQGGGSQLSADELAMALCRVLESNKAGDEIAADLLDLVGDGAIETVQELLQHRKELVEAIHHGMHMLKSEKLSSNGQPRMPSYGVQVTIQTEAERQIDKLRRKEEKRHKRGVDHPNVHDLGAESFFSLLQASERKQLFDDIIGTGQGSNSVPITALPQGTTRSHHSGYEEVRVPPTPTAPMRPDEKLIDIRELDEFAQAAFQGYKSLNRIQSRIFHTTYNTNENILVCAPTGAGKTNIAMIAVLHEIKQHFHEGILHKNEFKIVYVAPMKALAAEVTSTFGHRLAPLNLTVRELTGDMQLSKNELGETQMIVTTPEKWDVITRKSSDMSMSMLVKLLIIDEVHLLNDDRGPVIEALVARTLRQVESTQSMIRILGLSATLPNYLEVAQFLRVNPETGLFFFDSSYRPVPLAQQYIGITEQNFVKRNEKLNEICFSKVVESLRQGHQVMVFVHARKDTGRTAKMLTEFAQKEEQIDLFKNEEHPQFNLNKKEVNKSRNKEVVQLFDFGVGIHHAGMLRTDRSLTERLFAVGILKVLVCTATLAWGVNLPAHTVIIKGTQIYDPKAGGWRDLGMLDVMQIFGRAGRPQFDKSGEGIIITTHDKLAHYLRLLTSQLPIESQFISALKDNLNAEVALGTVTNVKEACAWLGYTYLFIRMKTNPLAYGISWDEVVGDPSLIFKQRSFITDAARALDKAKMMRFDEKSGNFYCTELGRIASHFYIQYSSVETYNEMLKRHMSDSEVINMVAHSSEFENIVVRDEEQDELEKLVKTSCPVEVKGGPSNKHGKVAILIQVYISRASIESFSLISDATYISASLARIMRALFEICLRRGWCEMTSFMLDYCKAVDRQIWPHQHPLRQFDRDISADILRKLEERDADLDHLCEMEEKDIGILIRYIPGGKLIKQYLGFFPWISLSANVSPITRTVLKVDLLITPDFVWKDRFHGFAERFWILVEDSENDHIYHSELFTLNKKMAKGVSQKISFTVPIFEPHPPQYFIRAVSDSWLYAEAFHSISFHNLTLPETQMSHTELLDLKPLPVSALGNEQYEGLYRFSHFNPIQTQAFHVLYHTDTNVLLGAPTGSGKTISAELAMFRLFNTQPDMKVIYIAPLKALVRERMIDWRKRLVAQLGKKMVEMTGDITPDLVALLSADIIISTPEKWDGISRSWHNRAYVMKVGLMILDEIHLLGADRGPILEVIVSRMRYISSQTERAIRFIGLSTALANAGDLADWLGVGDIGLFNFKPSVRPVPLEAHIQGYPGKFYCPRMNSMNKPAYAAICTHSPTKPVLIFVSSRRQTRLTALDLIQFAASDERPRAFLNMPEEALQMVLSQITDNNLRHTLQFGIGLHHAGLNDKDRSLVEELFGNNKIQVLVSTSTLAWGVNLPAHLVIIKGTEYYDGKTKRYIDFPITDILQMMGRAGRPQFDQHGKAVILVHEPKKSFYKKFLYEPFPVESNLREHLHNHMSAEIVSGTISHKEDAVHYLTWTYFFRRLVINPSYYGLEDTEAATLNLYLSRLVQNIFEDLEDSGCIKVNENSVEPTMLGSIASHYYLSYLTISMFGSNIGPSTSLEVFLHILSGASEYDELPVRHNEENYNAALAEKVPLQVDINHLDDPHVKANLLFQAHFSRMELPISDYVTDLKSVLDQSIRIIQAMIDICANSGLLSSAVTCMHLLQMVMQGLWFEDSSLWMLPCMNQSLYNFLRSKGISRLQDLLDLPRMKLQLLLQQSPEPDLYQDLQHFPSVQVRLKLHQRCTDGSKCQQLNINLEKKNWRYKSSAFTPRFPKVKEEAWWLVLGNVQTSELLALKRVSFSDRLVTRVQLPSEPASLQALKLILVSDCYVGFEQEFSIEDLV